MKCTTILTTALLASPLGLTHADDFDMFAPSWRGGQYSVQVGWQWPIDTGSLPHLPPSLLVTVDGFTPGTLTNSASGSTSGLWAWVYNNGHPGLQPQTGYPGPAVLWVTFPTWDRGVGPERTQVHYQFTFDGPAPSFWRPGNNTPNGVASYPDTNHLIVDFDDQDPSLSWNGLVIYGGTDSVLRGIRIDTILVPAPSVVPFVTLCALRSRHRR